MTGDKDRSADMAGHRLTVDCAFRNGKGRVDGSCGGEQFSGNELHTKQVAADDADNCEMQDNWFSPPNEGFPYHKFYSPLNLASNEIRLVALLPGTDEEQISCQFHVQVSLDQHLVNRQHHYEAVSYCAGDPLDNVPILLDGYNFRIFRSLSSVLKTLRRPDSKRILWIDQICINQTDIPERDSQVLLMKKIYESADSTLVWLGEATPQSSKGFSMIQDFISVNGQSLRNRIMQFNKYGNEYLQCQRKRLKLFPNDVADYLESERVWNDTIDPVQIDFNKEIYKDEALLQSSLWILSRLETDLEGWLGVLEILQRRYWTRCWIFQEVIVSARLHISCGLMSIVWEDFVLLIRVFLSAANLHMQNRCSTDTDALAPSPRIVLQDFFSTYGAEHLIPCLLIANARRDFNLYNLSTNLTATRTSLASDPRDKVYSLLALLDGETSYHIRPDYSVANTKEDVFIAAAKAVILYEQSWSVLAEVSGQETDVGLPSWAPDWTSQERGTDLSPENLPFCAGGSHFVAPEFLENNRVLKASAFVLGAINILGLPDDEEDGTTAITMWTSLFRSRHPTPDMMQYSAFLRTLDMNIGKPRYLPDLGDDSDRFVAAWSSAISDFAQSQPAERGSHRRRFFMTATTGSNPGYMGVGPEQAQDGDVICIFRGSKAPMVVRPAPSSHHAQGCFYHYVGEAYVDGVMYGELFQEHNQGEVALTPMSLV